MVSGDDINIITLARGEIMLRMVKLRRRAVKSTPAALVKSPRNARWCMRYHAKHAILQARRGDKTNSRLVKLRSSKPPGYDEFKIGTPLKTAVTDNPGKK